MEHTGFSRIVLPNGLTILLQKEDRKSMSFGIGVRFGSAHHGAAHSVEHVLFKGTKTKTDLDILRIAARHGGELDGFVGFFSTFFMTKNIASYGYEVLELLCDMIANSTFPKEEVARERKRILSEHMTRSQEPERILMDRIYRTLYCDTPLERAVMDDKKLLQNISRDDLFSLYQMYYVPSQLVVVGVGDIDTEKVKDIVTRYFPKTEKIGVPSIEMPSDASQPTSGKIIISEGHKKDEVHLMVGFKAAPRTHPDFYPLRVLSMIIGGSIFSRLWKAASARSGLVYNIDAHFDIVPSSWVSILKADCTAHHGVLRIYSIFSTQNIGRIEKIIEEELEKLTYQLVSEEELSYAKDQLIGNHILGTAGTSRYMHMLLAAEINNSIDEFHIFEEKIRSVKAEDVKRVAEIYCQYEQSVSVQLRPRSQNGHKK